MVILQIHIDYIATIKLECDPPISGYPHRVGAFPITREPMKFQPRQVHILRLHRGVQSVQNSMYAVGLLGIYSAALAPGEKPIESLVAKGPDHDAYVMFCITIDIVMDGIAVSSCYSFER